MTTSEVKESIGQAMDGCLDIIRRYAPSTTSGNPPLPDPQRLRNVIGTLEDVIDALEPDEEEGETSEEGLAGMHIVENEVTESDEVPGIVDPGPGFPG